MAVLGARIPGERCTVTADWMAVPGKYPRMPAGELAERDSSDNDDGQRGGRPCGVSNDAAESYTDDGDEADSHRTENDCPQHARMAEGYLEVLAGKDPLADLEGDKGDEHRREGECREIAALLARTSRLAGMAVKVERIMPEAYSALTVRTASAPRRTAAIRTPTANSWSGRMCPLRAVMAPHCWTWEIQRMAPTPMEMVTAMTTVRQVEARV